LYYGNLASSLRDILADFYERLPAFESALIRCLDSDPSASGVLTVLKQYKLEARMELPGVVVFKEDLVRAANERGLPACFGEVLLFDRDRPTKVVPSDLFLTSDAVNFSEQLPDALEPYITETHCLLAFGDARGLNYATWDGHWQNWIVQRCQ
jgi:hypothetical protein